MKFLSSLLAGASALLLSGGVSFGEIKIVVEHNDADHATSAFKFKSVPPPFGGSATARARFTILTGSRDENGGGLDKLHEGGAPSQPDQPEENFFFGQATKGGRILVDLGRSIAIKQVNTYSWHPDTRGPQVYTLYASGVREEGFNPKLEADADPVQAGWRLLAKVDTRPKEGPMGGQYGVSISDTEGVIGTNRYLLFDISSTENDDPFGNTFYSEIAVIDRDAPASAVETAAAPAPARDAKKSYEMEGGKYQFTIDTTKAPKLTEWADQKLAPVVQDWYPKLVALLPSDGYEAPTKFSIVFSTNFQGVAATGGTRITGNANWYIGELKREAVGSIVHELVHVVQQYGRARQNNPDATRSPGWLVEGIPDYLRWYLFEPQSHGTEISRGRIDRARYDSSYRVSANFLNWVVGKYDKEIIQQLNVAMRERKYSADLWKEQTGHTVQELGAEWKSGLLAKLDADSANTLSASEKTAGWQLLFDGKDLNGWHNFKSDGVRPGWQIKEGVLVCADPKNAGDLVTSNKFDWFELQLDYNISEAGNSGIMYHVTDAGRQVWATGPEVQLEDNEKAADRQRCGWLYGLYKPDIDPKTDKTLDATKPVGQWNHVRLVISPEKCEHYINGVKYVEYVLHSDDFNSRVAKSKFGRMKDFAKEDLGYISLQGDHGSVSFRNIKILPLEPKK